MVFSIYIEVNNEGNLNLDSIDIKEEAVINVKCMNY